MSVREQQIVCTHAPATRARLWRTASASTTSAVAEEAEPNTLVFNGVLDYRPQLDTALFLVDEVSPRDGRSSRARD
jgi:hypothetical protein